MILGWFKVYVGLVSGVFKVGLVIYFWLVQGWFRIYVGLVCGLFGFAKDSKDLFRIYLRLVYGFLGVA